MDKHIVCIAHKNRVLKSMYKRQKDKADSELIIFIQVIVFKDLQKLVKQSEQEQISSNEFERLRDKPFWIWNREEHKQEAIDTKGCCFNHICGLPIKEKLEKPLFDYEKLLYDSLFNMEHYKAQTFIGKEKYWSWSY
jgi:hypothetical protein